MVTCEYPRRYGTHLWFVEYGRNISGPDDPHHHASYESSRLQNSHPGSVGVSGPDAAHIHLASGDSWYSSPSVYLMLDSYDMTDRYIAYYAEKDQDELGKNTLRRVNGGVESYNVEVEYTIIKNTILEERRLREEFGLDSRTFADIARTYAACFQGSNLRRTLGAALPACAQQLTGLAFLNTYASLFFKQSGFKNAFLITTILSK